MTKSKEATLHVYGIKNCNTVKKALYWLTENNKSFEFHDFKKEPATAEKLEDWEQHVPFETLVNKKGTTWRKLDKSEQESVVDAKSANKVLLENNSMIKRPIVEYKNGILVGFDEEAYKTQL